MERDEINCGREKFSVEGNTQLRGTHDTKKQIAQNVSELRNSTKKKRHGTPAQRQRQREMRRQKQKNLKVKIS
jgi:hypothetical protein